MEANAMGYTVSEFCRYARISEGLYFKLQRRGEGPSVARMGRRVVITYSSAQKWIAQRETATERCADRASLAGLAGSANGLL
jgi:hypothetical protein